MTRQYTSRGKRIARRYLKKRGGYRKKQYGGRKIKQPVQYFTRSYFIPGHIQIPTGAPSQGYSDFFTLNSLPDFTDFTALYDQYMIKGIKYTLIPRISNAGPSGAVGNPSILGNIWSVLDYDDTNVPPSLNTLLQYQNVKRTQYHKIHKRYFKPAVELGVGSPLTSSAVKKYQWLDVANTAVPHLGIKLWVDGSLGSYPLEFDLQVKFYMAFKNVR